MQQAQANPAVSTVSDPGLRRGGSHFLPSLQALQSLQPSRRLSLRRFRGLRTDRWTATHLVLAAAMGLLGVLATFDVWQDIAHLFMKEPEYSHIVLAPVVAVWM